MKAGEKKRVPGCEYGAETEGSNTGEVPWKGSGSEDLDLFVVVVVVAIVIVIVIVPWQAVGYWMPERVVGMQNCISRPSGGSWCLGALGPMKILEPCQSLENLLPLSAAAVEILPWSFASPCRVCPAPSVHTHLS